MVRNGTGTPAMAASSAKMSWSIGDRPPPPCSTGQPSASQPSRPSRRTTDRYASPSPYSPSSSVSAARSSGVISSAKCPRSSRRRCSCSGVYPTCMVAARCHRLEPIEVEQVLVQSIRRRGSTVARAYLVGAARAPVGKRGGGLAGVHPADLGGQVIAALLDRVGVDPAAVDDVILGCVDTLGPQSGDIARRSWLGAGLHEHVPGVTVDRQCGSGQQAVHFAAQAVMSGTADLVVAGGVQSMSQIPISAAMLAGEAYGHTTPFAGSTGWRERYGDRPVDQFNAAEMIAAKWGLTRDDLEAFAVESHTRALRARAEGRFEAEIAPLGVAVADEGP